MTYWGRGAVPKEATKMLQLYVRFTNWLRREEGQDLIEYALLAFLIAVALVALLPLVATQLSKVFSQVISALS
jgi:Flp pilus assembly pilin Flp